MNHLERQVFAEFTSAAHALCAAESLRARSLRLTGAYSPFGLPELDEYLKARRPMLLPLVSLVAALLAIGFAYGVIRWTAAVDYPLNVGGRPLDSFPSDIPILFETGILAAAVAAFVSVLALSGLPRLDHELEGVPGFERTSIDRYWLGVAANGSLPDEELAAFLLANGALRVHWVEGGSR